MLLQNNRLLDLKIPTDTLKVMSFGYKYARESSDEEIQFDILEGDQ